MNITEGNNMTPLTRAFTKRGLSHICSKQVLSSEFNKYSDAIKALNSLQSNASVILEARNRMLTGMGRQNNLEATLKYVKRVGLQLEELEPRIIHITGTKGKGSTAIMTEALLRNVPYKTGLFLSPHITSVCERIMINGHPLSQQVFIDYFWSVYNLLTQQKDHESDMPSYFKFLTVMALKVFASEKVDVAIVEVGIGGELDCTNVFKKTPIVGITSIGLDHTNLLGNTVEKIAWQKAGIMKPGCVALTVPDQSPSVLQVFRERAEEKQCNFEVVPHLFEYSWDCKKFSYPQRLNASLAIQLAKAWTVWNNNSCHLDYSKTDVSQKEEGILSNCYMPGRCQVFRPSDSNVLFYLDGAHTVESIEVAKNWFLEMSSSEAPRILIFNVTKGRSPKNLLKVLVGCQFSEAIFCTNCISDNEDDLPEGKMLQIL